MSISSKHWSATLAPAILGSVHEEVLQLPKVLWGSSLSFFFPIMFVLCGMVLAVAGPGRDLDDTKRILSLALFSGNLSLFYVQLGDVNIDNMPFILSVSFVVNNDSVIICTII